MSTPLSLSAAWQITIQQTKLPVNPPNIMIVSQEKLPELPEFQSNAAGWKKGLRLPGILAHECSVNGALDPASLVIQPLDPALPEFERGHDYEIDADWGTVGRLPEGRIAAGQPVSTSYRYVKMRLDSVVRRPDGSFALRSGAPHVVQPQPPTLVDGETRVANLFIPGWLDRLNEDCLFPILETEFPSSPISLFPECLAKLRRGEPLKILAWGDSVTDGSFLENPATERWQTQFIERLSQRFPQASIELVTEAWGGHNTAQYLAEPVGSVHHYETKVLGVKPDLIISEFVNDAGLSPTQFAEQYNRILNDFRAIGAGWIILTPHYVRPDWMGLTRQRDIDADPRPYVKMLREFGAENRVPIADAAARWGRLWRQGLPYLTLHNNHINHPDARGMAIFADSLLELFPA